MYEPFRCSSVTEEMWTLLGGRGEDEETKVEKVRKLPLGRLERGMSCSLRRTAFQQVAEETTISGPLRECRELIFGKVRT